MMMKEFWYSRLSEYDVVDFGNRIQQTVLSVRDTHFLNVALADFTALTVYQTHHLHFL